MNIEDLSLEELKSKNKALIKEFIFFIWCENMDIFNIDENGIPQKLTFKEISKKIDSFSSKIFPYSKYEDDECIVFANTREDNKNEPTTSNKRKSINTDT